LRNPLFQIAELQRYATKIGWSAAFQIRLSALGLRAGFSRPSTMELKLKNAQHPLAMRTGASDRDVLRQVFVEEEYQLAGQCSSKTIIDLGANVGYTSAYLLTKLTNATLLAVEPDPANFAICCKNLAPFGSRATVIHGAVWFERGKVQLARGNYRDGRDWSTQVSATRDGDIAADAIYVDSYDMPSLLAISGFGEVDFLKIDIERSELELFSRNVENWLPRVRNLCIELHDKECEDTFFKALSRYSYKLSTAGDLTYCQDLRRVPE
jgi:FkbM family methyltransferase